MPVNMTVRFGRPSARNDGSSRHQGARQFRRGRPMWLPRSAQRNGEMEAGEPKLLGNIASAQSSAKPSIAGSVIRCVPPYAPRMPPPAQCCDEVPAGQTLFADQRNAPEIVDADQHDRAIVAGCRVLSRQRTYPSGHPPSRRHLCQQAGAGAAPKRDRRGRLRLLPSGAQHRYQIGMTGAAVFAERHHIAQAGTVDDGPVSSAVISSRLLQRSQIPT